MVSPGVCFHGAVLAWGVAGAEGALEAGSLWLPQPTQDSYFPFLFVGI